MKMLLRRLCFSYQFIASVTILNLIQKIGKFIDYIETQLQTNNVDCGVFMCINALSMALQQSNCKIENGLHACYFIAQSIISLSGDEFNAEPFQLKSKKEIKKIADVLYGANTDILPTSLLDELPANRIRFDNLFQCLSQLKYDGEIDLTIFQPTKEDDTVSNSSHESLFNMVTNKLNIDFEEYKTYVNSKIPSLVKHVNMIRKIDQRKESYGLKIKHNKRSCRNRQWHVR